MPKVEDSKRHLVAAFVAFIDRWASIGFSFFKEKYWGKFPFQGVNKVTV